MKWRHGARPHETLIKARRLETLKGVHCFVSSDGSEIILDKPLRMNVSGSSRDVGSEIAVFETLRKYL